jgi:hypothetical protein
VQDPNNKKRRGFDTNVSSTLSDAAIKRRSDEIRAMLDKGEVPSGYWWADLVDLEAHNLEAGILSNPRGRAKDVVKRYAKQLKVFKKQPQQKESNMGGITLDSELKQSVGMVFGPRGFICNCTMIGNIIVHTKHGVEGRGSYIFWKNGTPFYQTWSEEHFVPIGSDLVFCMNLLQGKVKALKFALPEVGKKCMIISNAVVQVTDDNQPVEILTTFSSGVIRGDHGEHLGHTCNSKNGDCGSPILNELGHVVGIHDGTRAYQNTFLKFTDEHKKWFFDTVKKQNF